MPLNILQYESDIWSSADSLRSAGLKQSDIEVHTSLFFSTFVFQPLNDQFFYARLTSQKTYVGRRDKDELYHTRYTRC